MKLSEADMLYKRSAGRWDDAHSSDQDSSIHSSSPALNHCTYRIPLPRVNIKMPSMSSIIVVAAALFTISAPIAAAKKDCREGTYYCGRDLLAIGNLLELVDANDLLTMVAT